ncbi:MAG: phage holin family protein [Phycisphaerales bacterium]
MFRALTESIDRAVDRVSTEARTLVSNVERECVLVLGWVVCALVALAAVMGLLAASVVALSEPIGTPGALAIVSGATLVVAAGLALWLRSRSSLTSADDSASAPSIEHADAPEEFPVTVEARGTAKPPDPSASATPTPGSASSRHQHMNGHPQPSRHEPKESLDDAAFLAAAAAAAALVIGTRNVIRVASVAYDTARVVGVIAGSVNLADLIDTVVRQSASPGKASAREAGRARH